MDFNKACKGSCECEKWEFGKIGEEKNKHYESELEEGEVREADEASGLESPIQKGIAASVAQEQAHIRQSASPQRASHNLETAGIVVLQHRVIHEHMSPSIVRSFVQDVFEKGKALMRSSTSPERASREGRSAGINFVQQCKRSAICEGMAASLKESSTSSQVVVEESSTSAERGSRLGGTECTAVVQQSKYAASEGRYVNVSQSSLHRKYGNHRRIYSPSIYSSSKERHKRRKEGCFGYSDSHRVMKMIEEVYSERSRTLLLLQTKDRKKFNNLQKKQEVKFFQKHVNSYKFHYAHVAPTVRYCRMMLPKLHFSILRDRFHRHMISQLIKFCRQHISDRDKEYRIKERWIFEAKAGYLKKWFYVTDLTYSRFTWENLECCMADYSDGEHHLKYFDMQSITTQIEAIACNKEPRGTFATDITEPIPGNSRSLLETNEHTKLGFSVGVAEEMATLESRSSQYTCAPSMEFCHENRTQTTFLAPDQSEGGNVERPSACQLDVSAALKPAKTLTTGKASDDCEPILEHSQLLLVTNGATKPGFSVGVSKEMATLESSSLQVTNVSGMEFCEKDGTQIIFSAADSNEGRNTESPCASRFVTSSASGPVIAVSTDTENAAVIPREKRRHTCSSNDISEGPCCRSGRKLGEKDGTQISFSPATQIAFSTAAQNERETMESPCGSQSVMSLASKPTSAVGNDTENAASICREKRRRIVSGNDDISEGSCCRPGRKFGDKDGTQITLSSATQNDGGDMERSCAIHSDTDAALELAMTVNTDSENAASGSNEKQLAVIVNTDSENAPSVSNEKQLAVTVNTDSQNAPSVSNEKQLAVTVNTDSQNAPSVSNEKQKHMKSGNNISEGSCSRSQIKPTSNLFRTTLRQEELPAARSPSPSADNRQVVQAEDISSEEVPCSQVPSFAQVTEQSNMHFNTQSVMNHHHFGSTCQIATPPYSPPCGDTHSSRIEVDSVGASHVHPTSANQMPIDSTPGPRLSEDGLDSIHSPRASHVHPASANQVPTGSPPGPSLAEDGFDSDIFTIELSRLQKLANLITMRHQEKIEQLNLARGIELAQAKRKYDGLEYNLEVETLQRKRELKTKADKMYKQQILAEVLQVVFKASAKVVPDSPRGATQETMAGPSRRADQGSFHIPAPVLAPESSTGASLRQHRVTTQRTAMDWMNHPSCGTCNRPA
ncbi:uncharacterized protein LOC123402881 [Hordeum vulgare subsp. vulgare]|uniref:Uncharacterized protein n=1 Tax=Hordeum vulgare subsp. vulgare TaxID=112509 RepID=A0A8I6Y2V6_HORVV|nr:uncharacterized protein LOC123402881 [Hordeum vulgare subsp. vulgare]XP_044952778.1 uncharacterized protein LOC123402881 [Hordeum vulgare subsp. vulgare]